MGLWSGHGLGRLTWLDPPAECPSTQPVSTGESGTARGGKGVEPLATELARGGPPRPGGEQRQGLRATQMLAHTGCLGREPAWTQKRRESAVCRSPSVSSPGLSFRPRGPFPGRRHSAPAPGLTCQEPACYWWRSRLAPDRPPGAVSSFHQECGGRDSAGVPLPFTGRKRSMSHAPQRPRAGSPRPGAGLKPGLCPFPAT